MFKQMLMAVALAGCCTLAHAQAAAPAAPKTAMTAIEPSKSYDALLNVLEKQLKGVAGAMPADKYDFRPSAEIFAQSQKTDYLSPDNKGVRSFAENVKHVAQANYFFASQFSGLKPDTDVKAIADLKDKEQILAALQGSFDFAHKAMATLTPQNAFESAPDQFKIFGGNATKASMASFLVVHGYDHFGHLSEYLRMNGTIPPSSAK